MKPRQPEPGWGWATLSAVLLHGIIVVLVVGWALLSPRREPVAQRLAIEATVVTSTSRTAPRVPVPEPVPDPVPEPEPVPELEPELEPVAEPEPPPPPVFEDAQQREEALRREAEVRAQAEREKAVREKAAQEKAAQEKAAREKAAREKAAREKAEREKAAREKAEREKVERERVAAEQARARREDELNAQIAAEERAAALRSSGQMNQYIAQITARIERAWIRPPSARVGLECEVRVTQVPGGAVTGVQVGRCNGDEAVRQSIEAAVYRASPLPPPSDAALFDRNLVITFRPEG